MVAHKKNFSGTETEQKAKGGGIRFAYPDVKRLRVHSCVAKGSPENNHNCNISYFKIQVFTQSARTVMITVSYLHP